MKIDNMQFMDSIIQEIENDKLVNKLTELCMFKEQIIPTHQDQFLIAFFGQKDESVNRTVMRNWVRVQLDTIDQNNSCQNEILEVLHSRFKNALDELGN